MPLLLLVVAVAGWVLLNPRASKGAGSGLGSALDLNSSREDEDDVQLDPYGTSEEGDLVDLLDALSPAWPYYAGRGSPSTPWTDGADGVDCSGLVLMGWVRLGLYPATGPDRRATADLGDVLSIANCCDPVAIGDQVPGDVAIYPGHVMMVYGYPRTPGGHSPVLGASGGGRSTFGTDPNARVKLFSSAAYRRDFLTYGRLRPEFRR